MKEDKEGIPEIKDEIGLSEGIQKSLKHIMTLCKKIADKSGIELHVGLEFTHTAMKYSRTTLYVFESGKADEGSYCESFDANELSKLTDILDFASSNINEFLSQYVYKDRIQTLKRNIKDTEGSLLSLKNRLQKLEISGNTPEGV